MRICTPHTTSVCTRAVAWQSAALRPLFISQTKAVLAREL